MKRNCIIWMLIYILACSNSNKSKIHEKNSFDEELNLVIEKKQDYDSIFIIKTIGKDSFFLLREKYNLKLITVLNTVKNSKNINENNLNKVTYINRKLKELNLNVSELIQIIPKSPKEFKIYDTLFSNENYKKEISYFEKIIYTLAFNSVDSYKHKVDLCVLYTNMYTFMYKGIFLNETRIDDGYYFYDLNSLICKNKEFYCSKVWNKVNILAKSENSDLYSLYKCRCIQNNIDEFDFCE